MAEPSRTRNFFGGLVDRILPGSNYNRQTGQFSNIGSGIAGRAASVAGTMLGGPAVGRLISTGAGNWIDTGSPLGTGYGTGPLARIIGRDANTVGPVVPEQIGAPRAPLGNLGLGGSYQGWRNYMADPGSREGFGNNYIGGGYTGVGWTPSSGWGRNLMDTNPGSVQNFGNNLDTFREGRERTGRGAFDNGLGRLGSGRGGHFGDPRQMISDRNPYQTT